MAYHHPCLARMVYLVREVDSPTSFGSLDSGTFWCIIGLGNWASAAAAV